MHVTLVRSLCQVTYLLHLTNTHTSSYKRTCTAATTKALLLLLLLSCRAKHAWFGPSCCCSSKQSNVWVWPLLEVTSSGRMTMRLDVLRSRDDQQQKKQFDSRPASSATNMVRRQSAQLHKHAVRAAYNRTLRQRDFERSDAQIIGTWGLAILT